MKKNGKSMPPRDPRDPNSYSFWLKPLPPFDVTYVSEFQAKMLDYIGPFSFRAIAERERVDRLISGDRNLRLILGGKKERR